MTDDLQRIESMCEALIEMHKSIENAGKARSEALREAIEEKKKLEKMDAEYNCMTLKEFSVEVENIGKNEKNLPRKFRKGWK